MTNAPPNSNRSRTSAGTVEQTAPALAALVANYSDALRQVTTAYEAALAEFRDKEVDPAGLAGLATSYTKHVEALDAVYRTACKALATG